MLLGAILLVAPFSVSALTEEIGEIYLAELDRLDDLRLVDFKLFQQDLAEISALSDKFSPAEMDYFILLKASESALLSNFDNTTELLERRLELIQTEAIQIRALALLVNSYVLAQNYPNPFNPKSNIKFDTDLAKI